MTASESYTGRPTEKRFQDGLRKESRQRAQDNAVGLRQMEQAEVAADLLTKDPNWDGFLQIIQAKINACRAVEKIEIENVMERSIEPALCWEPKTEALIHRAEARTLEWVLGIPSQLRADAGKAKEILGQIETD